VPISYPLVWVHLGEAKIPKYLKVSLRNLSSLFPDKKLVLLVNSSRNINNFGISNLEVQTVSIQNEKWDFIKIKMQHNLEFRHEFWFNSLARFKALEMYMEKNKISEFMHVESDVTLLPSFPFREFQEIGPRLGYSFQGDGQGIASLLHVGSIEAIQSLVEYCYCEVFRDPRSTDMTILFNFARDNEELVLPLPTIANIESYDSGEVKRFKGVFDAISIGQFFFGIDSRNFRGLRKLFKEDSSHWAKPSKYEFEWRENSLIAKYHSIEVEVFTLHIHCKDAHIFKFTSLKSEFEKYYKKSFDGQASEIDFTVLIKAIYRKMIRLLRKCYA
jgi:hypothetical protein